MLKIRNLLSNSPINKFTHLFILLVFLCSFAIPIKNDEKIKLRINVKKGDTFKEEIAINQLIVQIIDSQKVEIKQVTKMYYTYQVLEVDPEDYITFKIRYDRIYLFQNNEGKVSEFDSDEETEEIPAQYKGAKALVGKSFRVKMNNRAKIKEISGIDEMIEEMIRQFELVEEMKNTIRENLKSQFGEEAIKSNMEQSMAFYPENSVNIGQGWQTVNLRSKGLPMKINSTLQLKERKNGLYWIEVKSKISPNLDAPALKMAGFSFSYKLKGSQEGITKINESNSWVKESEVRQNFSGTITMEGTENTTWPVSIQSEISLKSY